MKIQAWLKQHQVDLSVLLLFVVLTGWMSRRLWWTEGAIIVGNDPDVYINLWADWWTAKAIGNPDLSLWYTDYLFYPNGATLIYHSFSHWMTFFSLLLRPILGVLPAYNLVVLTNYVLAGLAMFQLSRYLTKDMGEISFWASLMAGLVFAFNSHNQYQSAHPVLVAVWCFPWAALYYLRAVRERSYKQAIITAVFVLLGTLTSNLFVILLGIWLGFWTIYLWFTEPERPDWRIILTVAGISALLILPFIWPLLIGAFSGNSSYVMDPHKSLMADMISPLLPHWYVWYMRGVYLGILPAFFLIIARHQGKRARPWYLILLFSYLLSIGPYPRILDQELGITLPWSLAIVPLLRNSYRINILLTTGLAMLSGLGLASLLQQIKQPSRQQIVAIICLSLLFIEYTAAPFPMSRLKISPFYTEYLPTISDDIPLAVVPIGRQEEKRYLYYQTIHGHKMSSGHISRPDAEVFSFIKQNELLNAGVTDYWEAGPMPDDVMPALTALGEADFGYFIIHKSLITNTVEWDESWRTAFSPLLPFYEDDFVLVYETP